MNLKYPYILVLLLCFAIMFTIIVTTATLALIIGFVIMMALDVGLS